MSFEFLFAEFAPDWLGSGLRSHKPRFLRLHSQGAQVDDAVQCLLRWHGVSLG